MLKIKFSHRYCKLEGQGKIATLVYAGPIRIDESTPKKLLRLDTMYYEEGKGTFGYYNLKKGNYVLLIFITIGKMFTTIRPRKGRYGDKLEYYSAHIGEEFEIVIKEEIE